MKLVIPVAILALAIAGCATKIPNPVSKTALDKIEAGYGASYVLLEGWRDQCAARQIPLSCRIQVPKAQEVARQAQATLIDARDLVDNHPEIDATTAIAKSSTLVSRFKAILAQYGVK